MEISPEFDQSSHQNLIHALGLPNWTISKGLERASLDIGEFGILVIGENGSGKSRLLSQIGSSVDLIFNTEILDSWLGIAEGEEEVWAQPWDSKDLNDGSEIGFYFVDPKESYREAYKYLKVIKQEAFDVGNKIHPTRAVNESLRISAELSDDQLSIVAMIYSSLDLAQSRRHSFEARPEFPYEIGRAHV